MREIEESTENQFENVCMDLKDALRREEDLQKMFDQNIQQIKDMEKR